MSAPSKTDVMYEITYNPKFVPGRSPKVNIKTVTIEGENKYFMKNHETGSLYDLSEFGYDAWNLIDGKRTVKEIAEALKEAYTNFRYDMVTEALLFFAEEGLLESVLEPVQKKRVNIVSAFWVRVSLIWESADFIQSIHRVARPLLKKWLLWPIIAFVTVMGLLFAGNFVSIFVHKENFEILGSSVVGFFFYFFIVLGPIIAIHEIAHGLALVHYGGAPREMGTGLYFFGPMFYIDVTDGWTLDRHQRIMVYAAGPLSEVIIASAIMVVQYFWLLPGIVSHILTMAVFYCFYGLLIDLSPLLETDGYNILCDVVKIPDLRAKSFSYFRRAVKSRVKKSATESKDKPVTSKTKLILVIYAVLAAVWAVYLVFRSLTMVEYMAQDTAISVLNVSSAILLNNPLTITAIVLSVASVLYFGMIMSGYGLLVFMSLKKAAKTTLRFEEIHDRDLSIFLYLPRRVSESLVATLRSEVTKAAKEFTHNFSVHQYGPMCAVVLRMSGAKLAFVQIKQHFRNIEMKFDKIYGSFLAHHKSEIFESIGVHGLGEASLASMLSNMGKEAAKAGMPEAKAVVSQVFDRQEKATLYLLNSVSARVWTIELPPNSLQEIGQTLLPTLLVEDLSITDLYGEVEDFKKRTIYGFDSLAKLAGENQRGLEQSLLYPEKYQVISSFEPIKSRIIFVGRTEQVENVLDSLGSLFVCQAWCGYLDNLLSEVNLSLFALSKSSLPSAKSIRSMKDGELMVLEENLAPLSSHEILAKESLRDLKTQWRCANLDLKSLGKCLEPIGDFKTALLNITLQVNAENLAHLPTQFESFKVLAKEHYLKVKKIEKIVKNELDKRKPLIAKKKRRMLAISLTVVALSAVVAFLGLELFNGFTTLLFLAGAGLLQLSYWTIYLLFLRTLNKIGRYPSLAFRQLYSFIFTFTESLYAFMVNTNILTPMDETSPRRNQTKLDKK